MATLTIEGRKVTVDDSFLSLSPEQQAATVEEIAQKMNIAADSAPSGDNFMGNVNRGIADGIGGLVDLVNPFDGDTWGFSTGSAREGLMNLMDAGSIDVDRGEADTMAQRFARGTGAGAATMLPAAKVLQAAQAAPGMVGAISQNLFPATATKAGAATEMLASGIAQSASGALEDAGAPVWAQQTAEILAPGVALPALAASGRGAVTIAAKTPGVQAAKRVARDVKRGIVPMTQSGAEEVAAERLRNLVGGEARAAELGAQIKPDDSLNLTPAQQTGDRNLLALEQQAANEDPLFRERLSARKDASRQSAAAAIDGTTGETQDASQYFTKRLNEYRKSMNARAVWETARGRAAEAGASPRQTETESSVQMVEAVQAQLDSALSQETSLWSAIPRDAQVGTTNAREAAQKAVSDSSFAQRGDVPQTVREILTEDVYADFATVRDMHGAYSKLRQIARSAMAGTDQNKNMARVANEVAEAILKDMGATDGATAIGKQINDARAFSRTLHETFDQGTVGKVLNRTIDGDASMSPEVALARTVGRGGSVAKVSAQDIEAAAPRSKDAIADFLKGKFSATIRDASGQYTPKKAREWVRNNREVLDQFPETRKEMFKALSTNDTATAFAARAEARIKMADKSPANAFAESKHGKEVLSIIGAQNPAQTARRIAATARKDKSGRALAGVKAAFTDHLIMGATSKDGVLSGMGLDSLLSNKQMSSAMGEIFSPSEIDRLRRIATHLSKLDAQSSADIGEVMNSPANKMVEMVVRIAAAKHGGSMGGGSMGGSIQTANIFTERARSALRNLTNARARQLLMDAIEDPELFRELLRTPERIRLTGDKPSKLAPYLIGAGAAQLTE